MIEAIVALVVVLVVVGLIAVGRSVRVVQQYEQGIIFRFGRVLPGTRGPGLTLIRPFGDRMQKVNMQIVAMAVPAQEGITRDNVSVRVDAVVYFRVVDPIKATINVQNYLFAISQQAQTSLRSIIGQSEMDQLLAERDQVNRQLREIIDEPTEGPVGDPGRAGRDQGRLAARGHEAVDVPAGRGRARAAGPDHHRRRRVPGVQAAGGGGQRDGQGPGRAPAAAAADGRRGGRRAQQHAGHAHPGGAAAVLRQDDAAPGGRGAAVGRGLSLDG